MKKVMELVRKCICREVVSGMPKVFDRNNVILLRIDEADFELIF